MTLGEIVTGQRQRWSLVKKLGEGDAGEVYLVESLLERNPAILKRPYSSAFSSDILRQASQIKFESKILKALESILSNIPGSRLHTPTLLDQSQPGTEFRENLFIIVEKAPGFDLNTLTRAVHFGKSAYDESTEEASFKERVFLDRLVAQGAVPGLILLRSLAGIIELFEIIHFTEFSSDNQKQYGLIWNDVKPEHLYWDPTRARLTVIDWGNGRFLEADGGTEDRHFSRLDDYSQFIQEMGKFLEDAYPDLHARLEWPLEISPGNAYTEGVKPLKERISELLSEGLEELRETRRKEADLVGRSKPALRDLKALASVQEAIMDHGEIPDYPATLGFYGRLAAELATENMLAEFKQVCGTARELVSTRMPNEAEKWRLLAEVADIATQVEPEKRQVYLQALAAGVNDDWATMLWELRSTARDDSIPTWWDDISQTARQLHLSTGPDSLTPYVVVSRLFYTLQAAVLGLQGGQLQAAKSPAGETNNGVEQHIDPNTLLRVLEEEVVKKWKEVEPAPPNAGIEYNDIDDLLDEIEAILPDTRQELEKVLGQPRAQAKIVMDAWRGKEFDTARRGLRNLLIWDPHRWRVVTADRALRSAPKWLLTVRQGVQSDEPFQDYLIQIELSGRELRNQVGPARWLDLILDTLKQLRNGARPADLIVQHPEVLNEIPWLNEYRSRETISLPRSRELTPEREQNLPAAKQLLRGMREGALGAGQEVQLAEPLDTWVPEARGSSARVFAGTLHDQAGKAVQAAIKVMRADRVDYAVPLFREEVQILSIMRNVPGVNRMMECGFIRLNDGMSLPADDRQRTGGDLSGQVLRYGVEDVQNFLSSLDVRAGEGWLPYLAVEKRDKSSNLMVYCDAGYTRGQFLPLSESLLLAIQICDILQVAHDRNIVYRDHKILHYYWDVESHGVCAIDWNIAKHYPQGLSSAEEKFDLVQFGARAMHHILTGRTAPGALPMGPNRPEDIEQASHSYQVQWTYDDERLPNSLKEILAQTLNEGYAEVKNLRQDLLEVYQQVNSIKVEDPDQVPG